MRWVLLFFVLTNFLSYSQDQLVGLVEAPEQKEPCLQTIKGQVRDQATNELLPNVIISLVDKNGTPVETQMVTNNAAFVFKVACENTYKLVASKETYNSQSKEFTTTTDSGVEFNTKIFLDQGRIDFLTDPANAVKDNDATLVKSKTEIKPVEIEDISIKNSALIKEDKSSEEKKTVENQPVVKAKRIAEKKTKKEVLVLKPVLFDYESSYLNQQAKRDLLKVVDIMKKNPDIVLECASYTDAKGSEKYNLWMSKRRAKRTVEYIIKRGIDPQRITGKGYGESKLINDCTEGDDCTDAERAVNRRTEFIIKNK